MRPGLIVLIIVAAAVVVLLIFLFRFGKKQQKKQDEQMATIESMKQVYSMLIIDKKKLRIKDSGLPQAVIDQTPKRARRAKVNIVKAKIGPKIMLFIADQDIFDEIPVKKEVKATVSGLYITGVKGIHAPIVKPEKKKKFIARLFGEK